MDTPFLRMRRLRQTPALRSLVRETQLEPSALILPLFLCAGEGVRKPISSMPGVFNLSLDEAETESDRA
jgi:porphobilinogen synthase